MRIRITYANVAATLALVLSMSGGALAASHYLVNSTKQISPKVLKKLQGKQGGPGPAGKEGPQGKEGSQGKEGKEGKEGKNLTAETTLPSGQSESGTFAAGGTWDYPKECVPGLKCGGYIGTGITYVQPLATAIPSEHIIDVTENSAPHCPGVGHAERNYLCLYDWDRSDVSGTAFHSGEKPPLFSSPSVGVLVYWYVEEEGEPYVGGEYTVTAP
jgi:hypothetical protein